MPRKAKGPHLHLRERKGRKPAFVILDRGYEKSTGFGPECREQAEKSLSSYIESKWRLQEQSPAAEVTIADVLATYAREHAPTTADPARIGYAIDALLPFWGDKFVADIKKRTCLDYQMSRTVSDGTVRRELGVLQAALNYCRDEDYLQSAPNVRLPNKPANRDRWLTREEAAALLRAARRNSETRHIARFILVALYTGTRKRAILNLGWRKDDHAGHIDIEQGILYRIGEKEQRTKKERTPARLPRQLLLHARLWRKNSPNHVIDYKGMKVDDIKTAWSRICQDAEISDVTRHTLKHTAITWAMQNRCSPADAASFFATSIRTIEDIYLHHHPDHQKSAVGAMERNDSKKGS
nr:tyrosine-type recombinase/integrase [uncultured Cohaesibacter sp.]